MLQTFFISRLWSFEMQGSVSWSILKKTWLYESTDQASPQKYFAWSLSLSVFANYRSNIMSNILNFVRVSHRLHCHFPYIILFYYCYYYCFKIKMNFCLLPCKLLLLPYNIFTALGIQTVSNNITNVCCYYSHITQRLWNVMCLYYVF